MKQPPGYLVSPNPNQVCRLLKSLYGLKQAGRHWYQRLVEIMEALGFKRCDVDQAVFYWRKEDALIIVLVHVDDCTIAGTSIPLILRFKIKIAKYVTITDLGELHWILGIEVKRLREQRTIHLSQHSYIESMLRRYGLMTSNQFPCLWKRPFDLHLLNPLPQPKKVPICAISPITNQSDHWCTRR